MLVKNLSGLDFSEHKQLVSVISSSLTHFVPFFIPYAPLSLSLQFPLFLSHSLYLPLLYSFISSSLSFLLNQFLSPFLPFIYPFVSLSYSLLSTMFLSHLLYLPSLSFLSPLLLLYLRGHLTVDIIVRQ